MRIIKGDLVELAKQGKFDYIIHGANCFCMMGAGIAIQIARSFPKAYEIDLGTRKGDIFKLGDYSKSEETANNGHEFVVVNGYTQFEPGPDFQEFALQSVLYKLVRKERLTPTTLVGMPWIGCGIGGSSIEKVRPIILEFAKFVDLTIVEFDAAPVKKRIRA
jgi:O-acetyl-ADP-ribose deacetylase (regulator of RNase III)